MLLAAGYSRRFGSDKLMALLPDGTPVAVAAARALRDGLALAFGNAAQTVAVLRPEQTGLSQLLDREGLRVLSTHDARRGMGASLAAAVAAMADSAGWIVALADMPYLKPETVAAVANALAAGNEIVAPAIGRQRGHPVGFAATFGPTLRELDGDEGARQLLMRNEVFLIVCEDAGALRDVDTPEDLIRR